MKKIFTVLLAAALVLSLAACGSKSGSPDQDAPDLNRYFEDFMSGLGEENAPAMMDLEGQYLEAAYPGLSAYQTKQCVVKAAAISSVPFEFALVELENVADVQKAEEIFQARIDAQVQGGAFYPETIEGWKNNSRIVSHGNYVMLAVGDNADAAVEAFEALFA